MEEVHLRSTQVVGLIRTPERHLTPKVTNHDMTQRACLLACAVSQPKEDGIARIDRFNPLNKDAVDGTSINTLNGYCRAEGVRDLDVVDVDSAEVASSR